jgi:hypothetical protein
MPRNCSSELRSHVCYVSKDIVHYVDFPTMSSDIGAWSRSIGKFRSQCGRRGVSLYIVFLTPQAVEKPEELVAECYLGASRSGKRADVRDQRALKCSLPQHFVFDDFHGGLLIPERRLQKESGLCRYSFPHVPRKPG